MFEPVDFYEIDTLLTDEQKLIRDSIREFVNQEITPNIEEWYEKNHFPMDIVKYPHRFLVNVRILRYLSP